MECWPPIGSFRSRDTNPAFLLVESHGYVTLLQFERILSKCSESDLCWSFESIIFVVCDRAWHVGSIFVVLAELVVFVVLFLFRSHFHILLLF